MTLQEAADRLIAIVGHEGGGPPPAGIVIPFHAWQEFKAVAQPKAEGMFPMAETPPPVEEPPADVPDQAEPEPEPDEGDADEEEESSPKPAKGKKKSR